MRKTIETGTIATQHLTQKEEQVLAWLLRGSSNKDIATSLHCSVKTVEFHVSNLLRKHQAESRLQLVIKLTHRQQTAQ